MSKPILIVIFIALSFMMEAQVNTQSIDTKKKNDTTAAPLHKAMIDKFKKVNDKIYSLMNYIPAPIISYSTETNWLFGLAKFNAFDLNKKDTISQASSVGATTAASLNGQMFLHIGSHFHWDKDRNIVDNSFGIERFPRAFWGVGNDINIDTSKLITKSFLNINIDYRRKVLPNFYLGIGYYYYNVFDISYSLDTIYRPQQYRGYDGGLNSGFGLSFNYDTRDNIYNSSKGIFIYFNAQFYSKALLGSDYIFNRYIADLRAFHSVGKFTFAYQLYTEANFGNIPVYSMALLGGTDRMRGYYKGQYRDKTLIDGQFEIRKHLFWLIGGVAFLSMGEVNPDYSYINISHLKITAGAGLRLMVDQKHKTNLRMDFGVGKNTTAFFFGFSEAF